jgi:hypothetical protein
MSFTIAEKLHGNGKVSYLEVVTAPNDNLESKLLYIEQVL